MSATCTDHRLRTNMRGVLLFPVLAHPNHGLVPEHRLRTQPRAYPTPAIALPTTLLCVRALRGAPNVQVPIPFCVGSRERSSRTVLLGNVRHDCIVYCEGSENERSAPANANQPHQVTLLTGKQEPRGMVIYTRKKGSKTRMNTVEAAPAGPALATRQSN